MHNVNASKYVRDVIEIEGGRRKGGRGGERRREGEERRQGEGRRLGEGRRQGKEPRRGMKGKGTRRGRECLTKADFLETE